MIVVFFAMHFAIATDIKPASEHNTVTTDFSEEEVVTDDASSSNDPSADFDSDKIVKDVEAVKNKTSKPLLSLDNYFDKLMISLSWNGRYMVVNDYINGIKRPLVRKIYLQRNSLEFRRNNKIIACLTDLLMKVHYDYFRERMREERQMIKWMEKSERIELKPRTCIQKECNNVLKPHVHSVNTERQEKSETNKADENLKTSATSETAENIDEESKITNTCGSLKASETEKVAETSEKTGNDEFQEIMRNFNMIFESLKNENEDFVKSSKCQVVVGSLKTEESLKHQETTDNLAKQNNCTFQKKSLVVQNPLVSTEITDVDKIQENHVSSKIDETKITTAKIATQIYPETAENSKAGEVRGGQDAENEQMIDPKPINGDNGEDTKGKKLEYTEGEESIDDLKADESKRMNGTEVKYMEESLYGKDIEKDDDEEIKNEEGEGIKNEEGEGVKNEDDIEMKDDEGEGIKDDDDIENENDEETESESTDFEESDEYMFDHESEIIEDAETREQNEIIDRLKEDPVPQNGVTEYVSKYKIDNEEEGRMFDHFVDILSFYRAIDTLIVDYSRYQLYFTLYVLLEMRNPKQDGEEKIDLAQKILDRIEYYRCNCGFVYQYDYLRICYINDSFYLVYNDCDDFFVLKNIYNFNEQETYDKILKDAEDSDELIIPIEDAWFENHHIDFTDYKLLSLICDKNQPLLFDIQDIFDMHSDIVYAIIRAVEASFIQPFGLARHVNYAFIKGLVLNFWLMKHTERYEEFLQMYDDQKYDFREGEHPIEVKDFGRRIYNAIHKLE